MDLPSSSSEDDMIDDTGCEERFQATYWDINYIHSTDDNECISENEEEETPHAKVIRRFVYKELDGNGEQVEESYIPENEEEEEEEYSEESTEWELSNLRLPPSESSSDEEEETANGENNGSIEIGVSLVAETDIPELYDPNRDEKDAAWMEQKRMVCNGW